VAAFCWPSHRALRVVHPTRTVESVAAFPIGTRAQMKGAEKHVSGPPAVKLIAYECTRPVFTDLHWTPSTRIKNAVLPRNKKVVAARRQVPVGCVAAGRWAGHFHSPSVDQSLGRKSAGPEGFRMAATRKTNPAAGRGRNECARHFVDSQRPEDVRAPARFINRERRSMVAVSRRPWTFFVLHKANVSSGGNGDKIELGDFLGEAKRPDIKHLPG